MLGLLGILAASGLVAAGSVKICERYAK
jgi:hypothetical protein